MAFDDDPVGNGFVASLARPAGNITGLSTLAPEISGKQMELLKETSTVPQYAQMVKELELVAKAFGVKVQYLDVLSANEINTAFRTASNEQADAVMVLGSPILNSHRTRIVRLAAKSRLPATYSRPEYVEEGGGL